MFVSVNNSLLMNNDLECISVEKTCLNFVLFSCSNSYFSKEAKLNLAWG